MIASLIPILGSIAGQAAKKIFPNPEDETKRLELENQLKIAAMQETGALERAAADIVKAEAEGEGWLQRNWRPIMMLTFGVLIVARWFGLAAPNLSEVEYVKLWDIVQIGLGGYVIGRSVEKIAPSIADVLKK